MYIVFEGIDGSGKSTQSRLLKKWLIKKGFNAELIVEPSDGEIGKLIRKFLKNPDATSSYMQKTLGLLFAADRMLLMKKIDDLEKENIIIISDRSFYSSIVYQKHPHWIEEINRFVKKPDAVFLLDIDLETSISRTEGTDEFENKEFLKSVKEKYLKLAENTDNFKIIDASKSKDEILEDIKKEITKLIQ